MSEWNEKIVDRIPLSSNYGYISYKHPSNLYFRLAKLTYETFDNEEFQYRFEPYYDVLDALNDIDIPGIDVSLRLPEYVRSNFLPVFISDRTIPKNRVNLQEELKDQNQSYYNPFLLLLDSKKSYSGDRLVLKSEQFYLDRQVADVLPHDLYKCIPAILQRLASKDEFAIGDLLVNQLNRTTLIKNYLFLYQRVSAYYDEKSKGNQSKTKKTVSFIVLQDIWSLYRLGILSIDEAVQRSGLQSKSTFYRRVKELHLSAQ